jgi:hypothetical protein
VPRRLAARAYQRTTYAPGEIGQVDWWHTGARIPVGRGRRREAFGLVTSLPFSAAHGASFTFSRTVGTRLRRCSAVSLAWAARYDRLFELVP